MADSDPYLEFARYNAWANRRVAELLETLTDKQARPPLRLFSHILRAEQVWLGRMRGTEAAALPIWETDPMEVCRKRVKTTTEMLDGMLSSLTAADLNTTVSYTTTQGAPYSTPVRDVLSHVFNHGTHHRGQIALLVRDAGHAPHSLDYIAYVRLGST